MSDQGFVMEIKAVVWVFVVMMIIVMIGIEVVRVGDEFKDESECSGK